MTGSGKRAHLAQVINFYITLSVHGIKLEDNQLKDINVQLLDTGIAELSRQTTTVEKMIVG